MRVLAATADAVTRAALASILESLNYEVTFAGDSEEAWRVLNSENPPPLALLDCALSAPPAMTLCRRLRDRRESPYLYVILLEQPDHPVAAQAFAAGADDYLDSLVAPRVELRLRAAEHILNLQRNLMASRQALEYKSTHDSLTGVWNRSEVLETLQREIARCEREGQSLVVVMVDVDHFKRVNDMHGHVAGDAALREVTGRLRSSIRPYDALGRYGGEEFIGILPGCSKTNAIDMAERLRLRIASEPVDLGIATIPITISLGLAMWQSGDECDMQAVLRAADAALYRAKRGGRNRVEAAWVESTSRVSIPIDPTIAAA
ncbi:MAG: diguanylate cyclase [Armatimonadia bacterium]